MPVLSWFQIGAGAIAAFALSYLLHTVDVDRIEAAQRAALAAQEKTLTESCEKDKQITKDANDDLQKQNETIAAKLAASERLHPAACIVPTGSGKTVAANGRSQHAGRNGISTDWLRDYAARCETYRQQRIILEKFIDDIEARPQE